MACCTTIPPLNNKRKSGGLFDLPRSAKQRRPLSSSNLSSSTSFLTSNTSSNLSKSTMFTTAASAVNKPIFVETDSNKSKTSPFQTKSSYSPLGALWNAENQNNQESDEINEESQFKNELMERIRHEAKRLIKRKQMSISTTNTTDNINTDDNISNEKESPAISCPETVVNNSTKKNANQMLNHNDLPIFSMNQVNQICERMLKERETTLREQYDRILSQKMSEQYDAFVKFTHEQIQRRFENSQCSYVS